jgi:hypothetical protein
VRRALSKFTQGSSGGPDGLSPQHLKDLIVKNSGMAGTSLIDALTEVTNIILSEAVPREILPFLYGANLTALEKKGGGIRPIASGSTLRRIAGRIACAYVTNEMGKSLQPHQMGFGIRCGVEATVHASRKFIKNNSTSGLFLKLDFANAFNSLISFPSARSCP